MSKLLLDSQALLWFAGGDSALSKKALENILDGANELWVSIASLWEMSVKIGLGKLRLGEPLSTLINKQIETNRLQLLSISPEHTYAVQRLPMHHRDPFDRLIAVQAKIEGATLVSNDSIFDRYKLKRIW